VNRRTVLLIVVVAAAVAVNYVFQRARRGAGGGARGDGGITIPVLEADDSEGLRFPVEDPLTASWVGGHGLVLAGDADLVLDLATVRLRYLFPAGEARLAGASADGRLVVARGGEDKLLWGQVADSSP